MLRLQARNGLSSKLLAQWFSGWALLPGELKREDKAYLLQGMPEQNESPKLHVCSCLLENSVSNVFQSPKAKGG